MTDSGPKADLWPAITCLCPTYGRFERLRDAVACFLLQGYPGEKLLLICNDAGRGRELSVDGFHTRAMGLRVENWRTRFETLGHKRQALLDAAPTPLVAHWDDDDLYLPWHLLECVSALQANSEAACVKPRSAWWGVGPRENIELRGPCHNVFEGQMVFEAECARRLGGYPPKHSGQAKALLRAFKRGGLLYTWNPEPRDLSYVYRWGDGADHVSARKGRTQDDDFGDGCPLIPSDDPVAWAADRLRDQFAGIARQAADKPASTSLTGSMPVEELPEPERPQQDATQHQGPSCCPTGAPCSLLRRDCMIP